MYAPQRFLGRLLRHDRNETSAKPSIVQERLNRGEALCTLGMLRCCLVITEARVAQQSNLDHGGGHARDANTDTTQSLKRTQLPRARR